MDFSFFLLFFLFFCFGILYKNHWWRWRHFNPPSIQNGPILISHGDCVLCSLPMLCIRRLLKFLLKEKRKLLYLAQVFFFNKFKTEKELLRKQFFSSKHFIKKIIFFLKTFYKRNYFKLKKYLVPAIKV